MSGLARVQLRPLREKKRSCIYLSYVRRWPRRCISRVFVPWLFLVVVRGGPGWWYTKLSGGYIDTSNKGDDIDKRGWVSQYLEPGRNCISYMTSSRKSVPAPPMPFARFCFASVRVFLYITKWPIANKTLTTISAIEASHDRDCVPR